MRHALRTRRIVAGAVLLVAALAAGSVVAEGSLRTVGGVPLFVVDEGAGAATILLHGGFMDNGMWDGQAAWLAKRFRVVRFDFRGYGRSPAPAEDYLPGDDVASVLDALGIERAAVVGLSMGGGVAIDFALAHPGRVVCLVLGEPGLGGHSWSSEVTETMGSIGKAFEQSGRDAAIEVLLGRPVFASAKRYPEAYAALREQLRRNFSLEGNRMRGLRPPAVERIAELRMPVLVLTGENPGADASVIAAKLVGEAANARRQALAGAGHMMNLERPQEFNRIVEQFLEGCF